MRSPRFEIRAKPLRAIFSSGNLERAWKDKVRVSMREQFLNDGIENFDFHVARKLECQKLSRLILEGSYTPERAQRILVEKGKGLCRQIVIPSVRDALVLQCLSDALYIQIRGKAPTSKSFFEPKEHRFSRIRSQYGTFASWLNFQKELFKFSRSRTYVVITDIANYYDTISYTQLRNVIAGITDVEECVLDMLIYILSDLLWQPDYTPRVEVGLPQINLDAPRLLAHCFLYELDEFLDSGQNCDFVRYMDDIDVGVDSIVDAKNMLKSIDLVLQSRHIRLNSGKTQILTREDALRHFRVLENAQIDRLTARIDKRLRDGLRLDREKTLIELRIERGLSAKAFDAGNGEKILKRWITLAGRVGGEIKTSDLEKIIRLRPSVREHALSYLRSRPLTEQTVKMLSEISASGWLTDDAAMVDLVNSLVETVVIQNAEYDRHIDNIASSNDPNTYYGFYCRIWLQSKYANVNDLFKTIQEHRRTWITHERLGRIVGSLRPLFRGSDIESSYVSEVFTSINSGARDTFKFQGRLASDKQMFDMMFSALENPNPSRGTGITHAKFLCLLSALLNPEAAMLQKDHLRTRNKKAFSDRYYKSISARIGI